MRTSSFLLLGCIGYIASEAHGASIAWGNAIGSTTYNSDGSPAETGTDMRAVMFEIGVFQTSGGAEFTPTGSNLADWAANFRPLTPTGSAAPIGYDPGTNAGYFDPGVNFGSTAADTNTDNSLAGYQVYVWGYQSKDLGGTEEVDWILYTGDTGGADPSNDNWTVPDNNNNSQASNQLTWDYHNANTAIVGRINDSTGRVGPEDTTENLGFDDVQLAAVPEPSSVLLTLAGITSLTLRRRR